MTLLSLVTLTALALLAASRTFAAEISVEGSRMRVVGMLDGSGLAGFNAHLASGDVRTVQFQDSRGGDAAVAESYARAIHAAGVSTEVRGQCSAACAFAFLAGKARHFGPGGQINSLLIPLGSRPQMAELASLAPRPGVRAAMQPGADANTAAEEDAVSPAVRKDWLPERGVLFVSRPTLFGRVYSSYYCDGTQGRDSSLCEQLDDADPYNLNVLTEPR